ncbi:alpha/beta hydrolase [Burkholderia sp. Bp9090]|uniref:alpha/beta hydrolase family protein n=1 Tax=Burkholderia sp. Bp9090 TaxID=2184567 RepID=UPI000F5EFF67|nr:alpha/beta hydrolase family protein [Burkholderia sp. Bp9090]RQZ39106.1 alpha/beta hydrolase [Burkholderia sp. Bp9090]
MSTNSAGNPNIVSPFNNDFDQDVVQLMGRTAPDGSSFGKFTLTPASDTRQKELLCDVRPIIPVIFIPGVMGTLLVNKNTGDELFFPPNADTGSSKAAAAPWLYGAYHKNAAERQTKFNPLEAAVTTLGPINVGDGKTISEDEARRRGWGSVHRWSYHPFLLWLEQTLNSPKFFGKILGPWITPDPTGETWALHPVLGTDPKKYGGFGDGAPIAPDSTKFDHFAKFRYRVYAIGYNWLQSNADSAKQVIESTDYFNPKSKKKTHLMGIKEIIAENHSGKAIIVTHSMGGLVARMAIAMHDAADLMHGVFHGVQPATGAPLAAKRFRVGAETEGPSTFITQDGYKNAALMGRDENEFVAVTANAPGPLELLPMPDYNNGEPWWIFSRINGDPVVKLPKGGNAYDDIYTSSKWYGLVPDASMLDPAGIVQDRLKKNKINKTVLGNFKDTLSKAVENQRNIINKYHGNTYAAYANGALDPKMQGGPPEKSGGKRSIEKGETLDKLLAWGNAVWTGNIPAGVTEEELLAATPLFDSRDGILRVHLESRKLTIEFQVQRTASLPSGPGQDLEKSRNGIIPGDGTVPVWSARAQARGLKPGVGGGRAEGVQMVFEQGGYQHQFSYDHPWTRWSVLYSIVQIAWNAPEPKC